MRSRFNGGVNNGSWCARAHQVRRFPQQVLQGAAFRLNFTHRPNPHPAQHGERRAPPLQGVLQEERLHNDGQQQPFAIHAQRQRQSDQAEARRQCLQAAFHVPFLVQFAEPATNGVRSLCSGAVYRFLRPPRDFLVDVVCSVSRDAISGGWQHVSTPHGLLSEDPHDGHFTTARRIWGIGRLTCHRLRGLPDGRQVRPRAGFVHVVTGSVPTNARESRPPRPVGAHGWRPAGTGSMKAGSDPRALNAGAPPRSASHETQEKLR